MASWRYIMVIFFSGKAMSVKSAIMEMANQINSFNLELAGAELIQSVSSKMIQSEIARELGYKSTDELLNSDAILGA